MYVALDRLTKVSTSSATCASGVIETNVYDDAGNRTSTSGDQVTFTYDGESRRTRITSKIGAGATTTINLLYGGEAVAAETNAVGTVTRTYLTDETGTIVKVCDPDCTGSNPRYLVTWNGHGDAQALWRIEAGGALTLANSYTYSTPGVPTTTTHNGVANLGFRFLYVGRHGVQWDDFGTGLATHYMAARHYVPALGRFLQPDPSRLETNAYGYAENSPVSKADPQGCVPARPSTAEAARVGQALDPEVQARSFALSRRPWSPVAGQSARLVHDQRSER